MQKEADEYRPTIIALGNKIKKLKIDIEFAQAKIEQLKPNLKE